MARKIKNDMINIDYCVLSGAGNAGFRKPKGWDDWLESKKRKYINQFIIDFCIDITFEYEEANE